MTDQVSDVFAQPATQPVVAAPTTLPDQVKEFIGDGKKYASVEAALASIPHAQTHIQRLEQELSSLRESTAKSKTIEDILNEIQSAKPIGNDLPTAAKVDANEVGKLVQVSLNNILEANTKAANQSLANSKMVSLYGDKAGEITLAKAKELGVGIDFLQSTAQHSPTAFFELMGVAKLTPTTTVPNVSSVNSAALQTQQSPAVQSAKLKPGGSTKDMVAAWRAAGTA